MNSPVLNEVKALSKAGDSFRLNLGGRTTRIPGFLTVDLFDGADVDIRSDCSKLEMFRDGTVDEIYASHILEHWPHIRTVDVLKEWCRVIKPGGKLYISVPDFDAAVKLYLNVGSLTDFIRNLLWGDQEYDLAFHYTGFTFASLAAACYKAGFGDIKRIVWMPYHVKDCSRNVDNRTFKPISLSVEVTK